MSVSCVSWSTVRYSNKVGLGLAVVARIVNQIGGQLRVNSTVGQGSRFSFLIPLKFATSEESEDISRPRSVASVWSDNSGRSSDIEDLVEAISLSPMSLSSRSATSRRPFTETTRSFTSQTVPEYIGVRHQLTENAPKGDHLEKLSRSPTNLSSPEINTYTDFGKLRVLIVEVRTIPANSLSVELIVYSQGQSH